MTEQELKELNNLMTEFAGIRYVQHVVQVCGQSSERYEWHYPDSSYHSTNPNFTQSPDACFRWLVPELLLAQRVSITIWSGKQLWYVQLNRPHKVFIVKQAETLALALCLATEKLTENK